MKFIRKPTVVDVVQWRPGLSHPGVDHDTEEGAYVTTIHGQRAYLATGDWIMPEPDGVHFYPCKDDVFRTTYEPVNRYDKGDTVRLGNMIRAGAFKIAEYTVRDPETGIHGPSQFHMTYDNTVMAVMGEHGAKLFADFVTDALNPERRKTHRDLVPICRKFVDENLITQHHIGSIHMANLVEFAKSVAECIGYAKAPVEEAPGPSMEALEKVQAIKAANRDSDRAVKP